jgi:DnaK suppressor protein
MKIETQDLIRYSDEDLKMFDSVIDEKIAIAEQQLRFYEEQILDASESPEAKFKSIGESTLSFDTERLYEMADRQRKMMLHLTNAKLRIKNKVYGICRESGKLISKERLLAVPHATLSIEAKQRK